MFAYQGEQFEIDLRHECTHALLHAALPQVPLWLDEGLAVYFQLPARQRAYDNPHLGPVAQDARRGRVPSLEALEKAGGMADMGLAEYRGSWAWVHFMLHGPAAAHEELIAYLAASPRSVTEIAAAEPERPPSPADAGRAAAVSRPLPQLAALRKGARGQGRKAPGLRPGGSGPGLCPLYPETRPGDGAARSP